jgi:hypothetical protein
MEDGMQTSQTTENKDNDYNPINDLDLSGLTTQQRVKVKQMLEEEKESFSTSDDDIGCIEELELKQNMKDQTPVQKTYNSQSPHIHPLSYVFVKRMVNYVYVSILAN